MSDIEPGKWNITKTSGAWWAECPDDYTTPDGYCDCLCASFGTYGEALAHVAKYIKEARDA